MPEIDREYELGVLARLLSHHRTRRVTGAARLEALKRTRELLGIQTFGGDRQPRERGARQPISGS